MPLSPSRFFQPLVTEIRAAKSGDRVVSDDVFVIARRADGNFRVDAVTICAVVAKDGADKTFIIQPDRI